MFNSVDDAMNLHRANLDTSAETLEDLNGGSHGYDDKEACTIAVDPGNQVAITATQFNTEDDFDFMRINGVGYAGSPQTHAPTGDIVPTTDIFWSSDASVTVEIGWALCKVTPAPTASPTPTTEAPCVDEDTATDAYGNDCALYDSYPSMCEMSADTDDSDFSASLQCCVC